MPGSLSPLKAQASLSVRRMGFLSVAPSAVWVSLGSGLLGYLGFSQEGYCSEEMVLLSAFEGPPNAPA